MYKFLDTCYPTVFVVETKFGNAVKYNGNQVFAVMDKHFAVDHLCSFFSLTIPEGQDVFDSWLKTRPVYVRLGNSTTDVYVPKPIKTITSTVI